MRSMDANGDGVLQESEVPEERRGMLRMMAARMGQDAAKGIAIGTISQAIGGGGPPGRSEGTQNNNTPPNAPAAKEEPLVPGFGSEAQPQPVPSFGVRVETDQRVTLGTSLQEATKNIDPRMREEVRSLLSRYDRNHNRILEREEWAGMPGSPGDKDRDKDGKITMDELSSQASRGGPGGWPPGPFGVMPGQFGGMPSPFGNFSRRNETPENDDKKRMRTRRKRTGPPRTASARLASVCPRVCRVGLPSATRTPTARWP